jgi:molybdopterin-guanine dinucleotide biosynthesis protein B
MTPVLGFSGFSGSGKTTLLAALIATLSARGLRIGLVKHSHHAFDIDHPGKDSHTLRQAGACRVAIGSSRRWALMVERPEPREANLAELVAQVDDPSLDLILVEGFRQETHPKVEVHRPSLGHPLLATHDASVIAVATDDPGLDTHGRPQLPLDDATRVAAFVIDFISAARRQKPSPDHGRAPA